MMSASLEDESLSKEAIMAQAITYIMHLNTLSAPQAITCNLYV